MNLPSFSPVGVAFAASLTGTLLLTGCADLPAVEISPATATLRVVIPDAADITGDRAEAATSSVPTLAPDAIAALRTALETSGHTVITKADHDGGAEADLVIADVILDVERLAVTLVTGEYAHLAGSMRVTPTGQPTMEVTALSQPEHTRYYPSVEEATQRLMQNLINALNHPEMEEAGADVEAEADAPVADEPAAVEPAVDEPMTGDPAADAPAKTPPVDPATDTPTETPPTEPAPDAPAETPPAEPVTDAPADTP